MEMEELLEQIAVLKSRLDEMEIERDKWIEKYKREREDREALEVQLRISGHRPFAFAS
jgi:chromosome segregation ATPase